MRKPKRRDKYDNPGKEECFYRTQKTRSVFIETREKKNGKYKYN